MSAQCLITVGSVGEAVECARLLAQSGTAALIQVVRCFPSDDHAQAREDALRAEGTLRAEGRQDAEAAQRRLDLHPLSGVQLCPQHPVPQVQQDQSGQSQHCPSGRGESGEALPIGVTVGGGCFSQLVEAGRERASGASQKFCRQASQVSQSAATASSCGQQKAQVTQPNPGAGGQCRVQRASSNPEHAPAAHSQHFGCSSGQPGIDGFAADDIGSPCATGLGCTGHQCRDGDERVGISVPQPFEQVSSGCGSRAVLGRRTRRGGKAWKRKRQVARETDSQQASSEVGEVTSSDYSGPDVKSDSAVPCMVSCKHTFLTLSCWSAPIRRVQSAPQLGMLGPEMFELGTGSNSDAASFTSTEAAWGEASSGRCTTSNEVASSIKPRVLRTHVSDSTVASATDVVDQLVRKDVEQEDDSVALVSSMESGMAARAVTEHAVCGASTASSGSDYTDNPKGDEHTAGGALCFDAGLVSRFEALVDERYGFVGADARRRFIDGLLEAAAPSAG